MAAPEDLSALFGPAKAPAEESGDDAFHVAFTDFVAAYEANDLESAEMAFKEAVRACVAEDAAGEYEDEAAELMPPE